MGLKEIYTKARNILSKEVRMFNAGSTVAPNKMPMLPSWFWTANLGVPRGVDFYELRQYAKAPWVQMVKAAIKKQLMTIEWDVVNSDEEDEGNYDEEIKKVKIFLEQPNSMGQTFWEVWGMFMDDVLDLDAGVVYKGRNGAGELVELYAYDGAKFLFKVEEHGLIEGFYQYSFRYPENQPKFFERKDIVYGKIGVNTDQYPYGWSPLQSIQQVVELMIQSDRYNKEFFKNNATPDGIVSIPMEQESLERFKFAWEQQVKGKPHKLIFHNSDANFTPLSMTNKDMEWLEGQKWYFHVIFAAYGLSPQEVGFYENSNRSTGESQERISVKNAIKPYLKLIEDKINREIITELTGDDKIKFKWFPQDAAAEKIEHEQMMAKLTANVYTINEVRAIEGLDPVEWGEQPMAMMMQEKMIESDAMNNEEGKKEDEKEKPKSDDKEKNRTKRETEKKIKKQNEKIDAYEAEDYAQFLERKFKKWEKEILGFVDETLKDEIIEKKIEKSFGEFIRSLFNVVNTSGFMTQLKAVIGVTLKNGINEAENELNIDIGVGLDFDQKVQQQANRQLDGFNINGKEWQGIKGVAKDVQNEIRESIAKSINDKETLTTVKKNIKDIMSKYTGDSIGESRAMRIARTETNRMQNASKLDSYKRSGIVEYKKWDAFFDNRTSDICKRMHGQEQYLDAPFVDPKDGKQYMQPPDTHPNCRCVLRSVLKE